MDPRFPGRVDEGANFEHQLKPCVRKALEDVVSDPGDKHPARPIESAEHIPPANRQENPAPGTATSQADAGRSTKNPDTAGGAKYGDQASPAHRG